MRRLMTGTDAAGRSCVVEDATLTPVGAAGFEAFRSAVLFTTQESPPPPRPTGNAGSFDLGVAPGLVTWLVVEYAPNAEFAMHHTDSVDLDIVLDGTVELLLDDGAHPLAVGDSVVITGVDHGWRAGPDGCRLSVAAVGTPPPVDDAL